MKELKLADIYSSYLDEINALRKENKRLQEQLKEANEVIKDISTVFDCDPYTCELCTKYLEKWGVK